MPRTRSYAGPLQPGKKSASVRGLKSKKPYQKKKSGMIRKSKRLNRTYIQNVVHQMAETKYFKTTPITGETNNDLTRMTPLASRSGSTSMAVLGFALGDGTNSQLPTLTYGWVSGTGRKGVRALNACRAFGPTNSDDNLAANRIDGAYVAPSLCKSDWVIQIPQQDTSQDPEEGTPGFVRILRVKPRRKKYSEVSIGPDDDLFVDQYGVETGISQSSFNEYELQLYKVNTRKYELIEDRTDVMVPASTIATLDIADGNTITTDLARTGSRAHLVFNHKQPKKLYYTDMDDDGIVNEDAQPAAGQSNELIFFHFVRIGTNGSTTTDSNSVNVTCKVVSTFKEI